jgi:hypothetical protein
MNTSTEAITSYFGAKTYINGCKFYGGLLRISITPLTVNFFFLYIRTLQFLRNRSVLKDKTASEFRYRDELVNHLLSAIFYDVEDAIWIDT